MHPCNDEMRLWSGIVVVESCWHWTGGLTGSQDGGYASVSWNGRNRLGHRLMYELRKGPIPRGMTLDHLCRNRACINPDHLEPVTQRVNTLRGVSIVARLAGRTHCVHGHEFAGANLIVDRRGRRVCRACRKRIDASGWARRKAAIVNAALAGSPDASHPIEGRSDAAQA